MKKLLMLISITCVVATPAFASNADIEKIVKERLADPDSARFRDHRAFRRNSDGDQVACVMVNAKNSMGGYAGFKPFLVYKKGKRGMAINGFVNCDLSLEGE